MVRAPCCEKMGLKKGPWTVEEDRILISYIQRYGHENWRALPKQAGLLRCGKSCRLRWINYLRPDIKRGNFSREEEDVIIMLHEKLGNRWSAIAAKLPGRTDNEIKNVWHTHLKKRLKQNQGTQEINNQSSIEISNYEINTSRELKPINFPTYLNLENFGEQSSSENSSETESSVLTYETHYKGINEQIFNSTENVPEINEDLWSEELFEEISCIKGDFPADYCSNTGEEMDFWFNVFIQAEGLPEMPDFEENFVGKRREFLG